MGRKTGYAEVEADAAAGAIDSDQPAAAAGEENGCLLTTFRAVK